MHANSDVSAPMDEADLAALQAELDRVPAPLEPLDVVMLDGYLCGVLLQPQAVPASRWLPFVTDIDGRALPAGFDASRLQALAQRRHRELASAIAARQWFDPWIFELDDASATPSETVFPWVAGFAHAMETFPGAMGFDGPAMTEPLALVYRHLDPEDLEDADELLEEIESLEPPEDLSEAVEELVRATLLIADVTRPLPAPPAAARRAGPARKGAPRKSAARRPR